MIADINLLPRKEPRRAAGAVLAAFAVLLLLLGAGGGYWLMERANQRLAVLEGELRQVRAEQAAMEAKGKTTEQQQAEQELAKAVEWANRYPLKTVPLLRALAKQLPERGFIMNFSYAGQKTVTMTVQFDAAEEAAYYLDRLEEVHLVKAVKLTGISASGESGGAEGETIVPRYIAQYELELQPTGKEGDNE
ncbi:MULTISPECIES: fimbrial protein [Geobacillus thermoleovorans group]|uniref:Fimbrial assembly n=2 Tax=Geobacillus thermoleovorans group TaxID=1505648 RepID=U2WMR7_GEOKU|nr:MULTISPECIES: fimbrial protein [Geobacillus thermoleovorans group]AEV20252.1 Fimbrial assembly [Geobacillus thermoleovorans CCB_US3_UF5]QDY74178.1 PilN domain-containing protein [Geobacillus thermoleovorans]WMJ19249.1 fimbrial protein [Geobacillus kaustophilus]GAD12076.1 fimbrial assembly [Geobacillus kaustophilus GBlys]